MARLTFSADGKTLAGRGHEGTGVRIWDVASRKEKFTEVRVRVEAAAFGTDGKTVVTCADEVLRTWDACTGREQQKKPAEREHTQAIAFSPDGKLQAFSGTGVVVRDLASGKAVVRPQGGPGMGVLFSYDGKRVAAWNKAGVSCWEVGQ